MIKREELRERQRQEAIGRRYGHSVIIAFTNKLKTVSYNHKSSVYLLRCDCGNTFEKAISRLSPNSNCGCITKERRSHKRGTRLPYGVSSFNEVYQSYRNRAKYTGKDFSLTVDEFRKLTSGNCHYCGIKPLQRLKQSRVTEEDGIYLYNGIDRLDSSLGYIQDNCVSCCEICNKAKRDMGEEEFMSWIQRLIKHISNGL
jgi:hypothetical protein